MWIKDYDPLWIYVAHMHQDMMFIQFGVYQEIWENYWLKKKKRKMKINEEDKKNKTN